MEINLKTTKQKVKFLLEKFPQLRDSDYSLIVQIWRSEIEYQRMTGESVLRAISKGEVTNPEAIRRCRQKLNEMDPSTRGESYKRRQLKETVIRGEIINL
jgi:hypothetical protein